MKENKKNAYIELLRFFSTLAVVMIHISMTVPNNSSVDEIGVLDYSIYSVFYALSKWAVPVFIMISGSLILNPLKEVDNKKLTQYIFRMIYVLLSFGIVYALMEQVFNNGLEHLPKSICISFVNVIQGKSWDHLWYVYLCIGLYLITPFIRAAIKSIDENNLLTFIIILFSVNYVCRFVSIGLHFSIGNLYVVPNEYLMYYVCGYYCTLKNNFFERNFRKLVLISIIGLLTACFLDVYCIITSGEYVIWLRDANFINGILAITIFVAVKNMSENLNHVHDLIKSINICSFGIYLIHPFWINVIYRVLKITPAAFPSAIIGVIILWLCVLMLSYFSTLILKIIPGIKKVV